MNHLIKLIMAPFLLFITIFLIIQGYKKYKILKIRHLLKVWKKKYHPFPTKK